MNLWNSPVGPTTVHFWAPACNWTMVLAGLADRNGPPERISRNMTITLMLYSCMFMRFAWRVQPRNYLNMTCQMFNFSIQSYLL